MPIVSPGRRPGIAPAAAPPQHQLHTTARIRLIYGALLVVCAIFVVRLFYLQIIRHDFYRQSALRGQLKQYEIPAERGNIVAHDGSATTPIVLNETRYILFADPTFIKDTARVAGAVQPIIGGDFSKIEASLKTPNTRYVILAKKLTKDQQQKLDKLDLLGLGTREAPQRTYPQGALAAQVLGFVNDDGKGQYGLEEYLNDKLSGVPGELKAITDARGVPLVSNKDNVVTDPVAGSEVLTTLDIGMQRRLEELLKTGLDKAKSTSGSVLIIDPNTGEIKAMANYPSYDPNNIAAVTDLGTLSNAAVNSPLEVGSIMKSLTSSAALDQGVVKPDSSFYDEGFVMVGDRKITDVEDSRGTQSVESILVNSLNTGAVWIFKQMGGGSINEKARNVWYDYMTKHYRLGQPTGIEQAGEAGGYIPDPAENGQGIDVTYANTSFGQGMSATPLQMAAAFSSIVNGGNYYQPHLVQKYTDGKGKVTNVAPNVVRSNTISQTISGQMVHLLGQVAAKNLPGAMRSGYIVGGKTGTAQIPDPKGGYYKDKFNGTYLGFVGGDKPQYVVAVRVNEPHITGFAGSGAAAPIFKDASNMLIDNYGVSPKTR